MELLPSGIAYVHQRPDGFPDPFGRGFDVTVCEMSIAHGHLHIAVTEHAGDHGHRHAVHDGMARHGMTQVVNANILDAGFASDTIPER